MIPGYWGFLKQGGILQGYPFGKNVYYVGADAPVFGKRAQTIEDALGLMRPKDVLFLGPQAHEEGNLVIPEDLTNITIIGAGNRGACFIEPTVSSQNGLQVLADDVTLINVGVADGGTGTYGLRVGSTTVNPDRFRAYGSKFEGSAIGALFEGAGDLLLEDCELAWAPIGIELKANLVGFCTQIMLRRLKFHNNGTAGLSQFSAAQCVDNLEMRDSFFDGNEDGTTPTKFINLANAANHGLIAGNFFRFATNATAQMTIGAGIFWGPNGTEAGWSLARPA
jgi:hypothetical protein